MNNAIFDMIMNSGNPKQFAMNILSKQVGNNPMANNLMDMINNNDLTGIESFARNMCKEMGQDPDALIAQLKTYKR